MIRIAKWNETFETAATRKLVRLQWLHMPTGNDSAGYVSLMALGEPGIVAFAVFTAICQWSATCPPTVRQSSASHPPPVRGSLARSDGRPLTIGQLSMFIRMPVEVVERSIQILLSPDVGWLVTEEA